MTTYNFILTPKDCEGVTEFETEINDLNQMLPSHTKDRELALVKAFMPNDWMKIGPQRKNNKVEYSTDSGKTWSTLTLDNGVYSLSIINNKFPNGIDISRDNKTSKITITLQKGYQLRFVDNMSKLFGFNDNDVVTNTMEAPNKADIYNDNLIFSIKCGFVSTGKMRCNGTRENILYSALINPRPINTLCDIVDKIYYTTMDGGAGNTKIWITDQDNAKVYINKDSSFHINVKEL